MSEYMDITVDVATPKTRRDITALGVLNGLTGKSWVNTADVRAAVLAVGGDWNRRTEAVKALRNIGYNVAIIQRREHTIWRLNPSTAEATAYFHRFVHEAYSRELSTGRALSDLVAKGQISLQHLLHKIQLNCMSLGAELDPPKTPAEVMVELQAL